MSEPTRLPKSQGVRRPLPAIDEESRHYWTGGKNGELLIFRCQSCRYYVHPPVRFCPRCEGREVAPEPVSGKGIVNSYTINHKQWLPGLQVPYAVALVSIAEQEDVRLVTNLVNCAVEEVQIGMKVKVLFEQNEDLWVPLFEPDALRP